MNDTLTSHHTSQPPRTRESPRRPYGWSGTAWRWPGAA